MINRLQFIDFMGFTELDLNFSKNINVISGENSTGKTAILKALYSSLKAINDVKKSKNDFTKENFELALVKKYRGCFARTMMLLEDWLIEYKAAKEQKYPFFLMTEACCTVLGIDKKNI